MIKTSRRKTERVRSPDFLAVLALFFLSLFFFYDLFRERFLLIERDLGPYFIPPRFYWVESIRHGSFPLWGPYQFCGQPFFANPQLGMLYPINSLFFFLPFDIAFNSIIILHFFLAGLFTYLFLRDLKVNATGAFISALIFMLSGYLLSVHGILTTLLSSVWTPLTMLFFRRAIYGEGLKNQIFTALLITVSFLGGGIEIVYGNFFVLLIMVIFSPSAPPSPFHGVVPAPIFNGINSNGNPEVVPAKAGNQFSNTGFRVVPGITRCLRFVPPYIKRMKSLVVVSILFLFLSAIQLFPFIELFHHSIRGNGISYQEATIWSFAPKDILLFFLPDAYGYFLDMEKYWTVQCWFKTLYTGGLPFILSLTYFLMPHSPMSPFEELHRSRKIRSHKTLFVILMCFSLFLSLGCYNPLYAFIFRYVPFFNGIRYPAKFLHIFILVLSITAGLGFQRLIEFSKKRTGNKLKSILMISSLVSGVLLLSLILGHKEIEPFLRLREIDYPQFNFLGVNLYHAKRFFFWLALFLLLVRVGLEKSWKGWIQFLLVVFLTIDLFGNMGYYGRDKTKDYFKKTKHAEIISSDKEKGRVFSTGKTLSMDTTILIHNPNHLSILDFLKEKNMPSFNLLYHLHDIWGVDVIRIKTTEDLYKAFIGAPSISATRLIDLYGVKYITSVTPIEGDPQFELIDARLEGLEGKREDLLKENTVKLYKNRTPFPRAWLVRNFKVMEAQAILWSMIQREFRPGQEVFLEEEPHTPVSLHKPGTGSVRGQVEILSESNNWIRLLANATEDCFLVLSDTYYPGWKAFVDGNATKIYRADYTFRAIPLNAGTHRVEFVYDPLSFKVGVLFTFFGIIGCVVIGLAIRRRSRAEARRKLERLPKKA